MEMRKPALDPTSSNLKELIKQSANEIARNWAEAVREDRAIPSADGMEEPWLLDAVPLVLDEILGVVEVDDNKIEHERICSAARHGRERALEHFNVKELVREYQLLRDHIFLYLKGEQTPFSRFGIFNAEVVRHRIGLALDEAMRETINAFVEEHMSQLRRMARTDSLTGLYNHRMFYERLTDELNRARRYDTPLSVVLVDLDNFKSVNETKGHQFGDHLLVRCAERLREDLRQTDILCRYGGDEFGIILTATGQKDANAMMARVMDDFQELAEREEAPPGFGMSFGLSAYPEDDDTARRLVKIADDRLLINKQSGRNSPFPTVHKLELVDPEIA